MHKHELHEFCRSPDSVSSELAKTPTAAVHSVAERLFGKHLEATPNGESEAHALEEAHSCGQWGSSQPSPLFLQIYADVLKTMQQNPLNGVCSPNLLGSNGVCPLTIIATIPDICRHMSNLIVRAEHEVFIATNYWMLSESSKLISNGLRELSRRCVANGRHVVVKVMYDRGHIGQVR